MKIKVSELFYSLQGEGRFVGVPSVFLRTYGCNFTCSGFGCKPGEKSTGADEVAKTVELYKDFTSLPLVETGCDSYASWHPAFKHLSPTVTTEDLVEQMLALTPNKMWAQNNGNDVHLVITGGEPLLGWQRAYAELLSHPRMADLKNITFETNGTQELHADFKLYLIKWAQEVPGREVTFSVSAKLSASGESWGDAICPEVVNSYQEYGHTYLKFVVETMDHVDEAVKAVDAFRAGGFTGVVYLMPQGGVVTTEDLVEQMLALTPNGAWAQNNGNDVHLVITGGEPLLGWQRAYAELLSHPKMSDLKNITFETNGTQELHTAFTDYLNMWAEEGNREVTFSVSAKLSASGESWDDAICPEVVNSYQEYGHTYLKFVVETIDHVDEAVKAVDAFRAGGFTGVVYLMPQGGVVTPYEANKLNIANICCERGFNYSPRLHVDLWGNGWGK